MKSIHYTVHNLYNIHGVTNISDYIFTKQNLLMEFAKYHPAKIPLIWSIQLFVISRCSDAELVVDKWAFLPNQL